MTCGASGNDSCCASPLVTGGMFFRSFDGVANGPFDSMGQNLIAQISSFRLDKYEITVGRFRAFVAAGMGTQASPPTLGKGAHPGNPESGWDSSWDANLTTNTAALKTGISCSLDQTWTDIPAGNEDQPMNCITWYEAQAFCIWDGGYLPSEAEWNYAAAGGSQQRAYPWSQPAMNTTVDATRASYFDGTSCTGNGQPACGVTALIPVGSKPAGDGLYGQADLGGNVFEWTFDWYFDAYPGSCIDCIATSPTSGQTTATLRTTRGGAFVEQVGQMRAGYRGNDDPNMRNYIQGARCARMP